MDEWTSSLKHEWTNLVWHDERSCRVTVGDVGEDADGLLLHVGHVVALQDEDDSLHDLQYQEQNEKCMNNLCNHPLESINLRSKTGQWK